MPAAKFEIKRKCQVCGQEFIAKTIESWYCSKRCSNIAYKRRKDEEKRNQRLDEIVKSIPKHQDYIKVSEAYALFGISKDTLYRLIHKGTISHINLGTNQIRVSKEEYHRRNIQEIPFGRHYGLSAYPQILYPYSTDR